MFGADDSREDRGPEYLTAFPDDASRQKQHIGVSEPSRWWLRSASNNNDNNFNNVNNDGSNWNNNNANNENGVVVGSSLARRSSCMKLM